MNTAVEKKSKLVGYEVRLDPTKGGMLVDSANGFTFDHFNEGNDRMMVTAKTDTTIIEKSIKPHGILRVYDVKGKKEKDVTEKFGGPPKVNRNRVPIVKKGLKLPDTFDDTDTKLERVLNVNDPDKIEKYVQSITDYRTIVKLIDLEKIGSNPTSQCRRSVLDMLEERKKHVSGITGIEKDEDADEEIQMK
jgi:hypothetical protein